ncbi:putative kynureninase [Bisporella sp. PMI_857]|nr:putative kynureninase [Bisporella sp. PMI_857]
MAMHSEGITDEITNNELFQVSTSSYSNEREFAQLQDEKDPLSYLREKFQLPSRVSLNSSTLSLPATSQDHDPGIYLCGNQIGLLPLQTPILINEYLRTWATQGMYGLGKKMKDSPLPSWGEIDRVAAELMAKIVGAHPQEVSVMGNLTTNLHLLMASFYKPSVGRSKIIVERETFSSDYYAIQSQVQWHAFNVAENMIFIEPRCDRTLSISTSDIFSIIETNASSVALVILSGVQYLSGQVLEIERITTFAHSRGILVGWDLAHAVGNIELNLHDWNVDFAVWCNYKYMNAGPGAIGSIFVHEKYGHVDKTMGMDGYRPRLAGWWGNDVQNRFEMKNSFEPAIGATGYQVSNPSILDTVALISSLRVFNLTSMSALRQKSALLTGYLEYLLLQMPTCHLFELMTSPNESERGAQLSLRFEQQVLDGVMPKLRQNGIVVAQKKNIMRVAPVPMYNTFMDIWKFVEGLRNALSASKL